MTGRARRGLPALLAALVLLAGAPPAISGLWSNAGGDGGRSGLQPTAQGGAPWTPLWTATGRGDGDVRTSVVVTAAGADGTAPRVAYGTGDGRLHLRDLFTGREVGPAGGIQLGEHGNKDVFSGLGGSVSPVDATAPDGLGQLYVVLNDRGPAPAEGEEDEPDVVVAQIDERSGRLVRRDRVPGTAKYVVSSSPVLTEPDASGRRSLVFTAHDRADWAEDDVRPEGPEGAPRVFRIPVANAAGPDGGAIVADVETADAPALYPPASPTLAYVDDSSGRESTGSRGYVTVSTGAPDAPLALLAGDALGTSGPSSPRLDDGAAATAPVYAATASVPLAGSGEVPGTGRSGVGRAAAIVVATWNPRSDRTTVHRLVPDAAGEALVEAARSEPLPGRPSPQLALTQRGVEPGDGAGLVLVTTGRNLYALDGGDLTPAWKLDPADALTPGGTGFARTTAAVFGDTVFVARDDGRPLALRLADGRPLAAAEFDPFPKLVGVASYGAPAVTPHGIAIVGSDKGVTAYRARCANKVARRGRTLTGTLAGDVLEGGAIGETLDAGPGDDCLAGGDGDDLASGGQGADRLDLGAGRDRARGGEGDDELLGQDGRDVLDGEEGADRLDGGFGPDSLKGGAGGDVLTGGEGADRLYGESGGDVLDGRSGADRLRGGSGRDALTGGAGDDVLAGGAQADRLDGGAGADRFSGGAGDDEIDSRDRNGELVRCGRGVDTVRADRRDRLSRCEYRIDGRGRRRAIRRP